MKKLFENWRKQINEMEYEPGRAVADIEASMGDPESEIGGRFDDMFDRGQPGNVFAEAVAKELMLDEDHLLF